MVRAMIHAPPCCFGSKVDDSGRITREEFEEGLLNIFLREAARLLESGCEGFGFRIFGRPIR